MSGQEYKLYQKAVIGAMSPHSYSLVSLDVLVMQFRMLDSQEDTRQLTLVDKLEHSP
jgi:hypothetical protein